ncbi:GNAT family N-acetyltransferase [Gracilibacillus timonensis]|uniref:GNAT family N-acetyltransferase n=1 Tax=Gracilibacillus timonensis TaxID=1816696 RepID=UPI0008264947|nr:GNAT family N-acetyltransferase [Gracilibacillus timonensis]
MGIRRYQIADEPYINQLFYKVVPRKKRKPRVMGEEWRSCTFVYEKDGQIIGHMSLSIRRTYIHGEEQLIGVISDKMIDPDASQTTIYQQLKEHLAEEAQQFGVTCIVDIYTDPKQATDSDKEVIKPLQRYMKINRPMSICKHLCYHSPLSQDDYIKDLCQVVTKKNRSLPKGWQLEEWEDTNPELVRFIAMKSHGKAVHTNQREQEALYLTLVLTYYGEIKGYVVFQLSMKGRLTKACIVDLLAIDEPFTWKLLLQAVKQIIKKMHIVELSMLPDATIDHYLRGIGMRRWFKPLSISVHPLQDSYRHIPKKRWWLIWADMYK